MLLFLIIFNKDFWYLNKPIKTIITNDRSGKKGPVISNKGINKNKLSIKELFLNSLKKDSIL